MAVSPLSYFVSCRLEIVQELQINRSGCPVLSCSLTVLRVPTSRSREQSIHGGGSSTSSTGVSDSKRYVTSDNGRFEKSEVTLYVGVFGDTAGAISVWLLPGSIVPSNVSETAW